MAPKDVQNRRCTKSTLAFQIGVLLILANVSSLVKKDHSVCMVVWPVHIVHWLCSFVRFGNCGSKLPPRHSASLSPQPMSKKDDKKKTLSPLQGGDWLAILLRGPTLANAGLVTCACWLQSSC